MSPRASSRTANSATGALPILAVVASLLLGAGAAHAGELTASLAAEYPVPPKVVWQKMGDFAALADWHPMVKVVSVDGSGEGAVRTVTWTNGATLVEKLTGIDAITAVDDETGSMATVIVETSLSITNYASQLKVEKGPTPGTSVVTWSSTFEAKGIDDKDAVDLMTDYYEKGLEALAAVVE